MHLVSLTGLCYKCRGPHLQCNCRNNSSNKFQAKTPTQQTQKGNSHTNKFCNNNIFPTGNLSFQASQPIRSGKDMAVSFGQDSREVQLLEETRQPSRKENCNWSDETIMADEIKPSIKDLLGNARDEDGLIELFDQFSGLTSPKFRLTRTESYLNQ